jgi:hypothetical protein
MKLTDEQREALQEAICWARDDGLPGTADQLRSILAAPVGDDAAPPIGFRTRVPGFAWVPWITDDQETIQRMIQSAIEHGHEGGALYADPVAADAAPVGSWPWLRGVVSGIPAQRVPVCGQPVEYVQRSAVLNWIDEGERRASTGVVAADAVAPSDTDCRERIAQALHYPACWDTAAYPTLESAVWEAIAAAKLGCSACEAAQPDERAAFDIALDALDEYQRNWDTGSHFTNAQTERIAMEGAVGAVREALNEARATAPQAAVKGDERGTVCKWMFDRMVKTMEPAWDYVQTHQEQFGALPGDDKTRIVVDVFLKAVNAAAPQASATLTDEQIDAITEMYAKRWGMNSAWNIKRCIQSALIDARAILAAAQGGGQ